MLNAPLFDFCQGEARLQSGACRRGWLGIAVSLLLVTQCQASEIVTAYVLGGRPEAMYREKLEREAMQKVDLTRIAGGLSPEQTEKLRLAAMGDVNRAMHQIAALQRATEDWRITNNVHNQKGIQLVQPFLARMQSLFHGQDSLFAKCLEHILDESQKVRYEKYLAEKASERRKLVLLSTVAAIDERVPLLQEQREKLIELLEKRPIPNVHRNFETSSGYLRLAGIPEQELNEFLDAEQTEYILKMCESFRPMLRQQP